MFGESWIERRTSVLLKDKIAVIYGAGGAIGGAAARTFAREGARVFLSGRTLSPVETVAKDIVAGGGHAEASRVDALDEDAVDRNTADVVEKTGRIDVVLNAIAFDPVQGIPLTELSRQDFVSPISSWTTTQFLTARSAARYMVQEKSGVILTLTASPARLAIASTGGFGVACAAIEGLTRTLAAELSPEGVRVVCIKPHRIGDTLDSPDFQMGKDDFLTLIESFTLLKQLPTLSEVAETAAFLASDHAGAITGTVANLTCGMSVD
jgi:3-oxoacyl-[acyl-carrier protein] reductase